MAIAASLDFSARTRKAPTNVVSGLTPELAALSGISLFAGLAPNVHAALAAGATLRRFNRRSILVSEGAAPSQVFVVLSGKIRAVRRALTGREVTLETFHAGDVLADAVVAPERQLLNDWEAAEPTEVLAIGRDVFASQLQGVPALALTLAAQMLGRLERSKQMAAGLALADVPDRVLAALRGLAEAHGQAGPEGIVVHNRPTQQEMANSIGACRETVSRVVSDLARRGLITPRGRTLVISRRLLETGA